MVEYIVAIDVTRARFPADAQVKLARLVREVTEPTGGRVCDHCVTTGTLSGGGRGTGSVHTVWVRGALHAAPHSGESPVVVVPVHTQRSSAGLGVTI